MKLGLYVSKAVSVCLPTWCLMTLCLCFISPFFFLPFFNHFQYGWFLMQMHSCWRGGNCEPWQQLVCSCVQQKKKKKFSHVKGIPGTKINIFLFIEYSSSLYVSSYHKRSRFSILWQLWVAKVREDKHLFKTESHI